MEIIAISGPKSPKIATLLCNFSTKYINAKYIFLCHLRLGLFFLLDHSPSAADDETLNNDPLKRKRLQRSFQLHLIEEHYSQSCNLLLFIMVVLLVRFVLCHLIKEK